MSTPLADRLRPQTIDDMVGQRHLLGENMPLRNIVESGYLPNLIFYGPSGTGKTTLARIIAKNTNRKLHHINGTNASTADIKAIVSELDTFAAPNGILLYLDEIQYFNKKQQQILLSYIENTLRETLTYKPDTYTLTLDDQQIEQRAFVIACANASQYGNNAFIAPAATMSDGLMDITVLEPFSAIEAPQLALQLFNGTLTTNSRVKTFKARKAHIKRLSKAPVHVDGDPLLTDTEIDVEIHPKGILMVVNPSAPPRRLNLLQVFSDQFNELPQHLMDMNTEFTRSSEKNIKQFNKSVKKLIE